MDYPKELLPKSNYKLISTDELNNNFSLIRKSKKSKKDSIDNIGDVRLDAICEEEREREVFGLSFNLFGIYKIEHIKITIENRGYHDYWNPEQEPLSIDEISFSLDNEAFPIFFLILNLHNIDFPYEKTIKNKHTESLTGTCRIEHKPTKCNFWHFELSIYSSENNYIKYNSSLWKKKISKYILKSILKIDASTKTPKTIILDKFVYTVN